MLIKDIVEDEGVICTEDRILWSPINRGSYKVKRLQVVGFTFSPCVGVF